MDTQTPVSVQTQTDPTVLTTQQLWREIANLKERSENQLGSLKNLQDAKIESIEKAVELAHTNMVRVPTDMQKAVTTLKDLQDEKFKNVEQKFKDINDTRLEQKADSQGTLALALSAAKEAVSEQNKSSTMAIAKSEQAMNDQLKSLNSKIEDLKEQFIRAQGESLGAGMPSQFAKRITELETSRYQLQGRSEGSNMESRLDSISKQIDSNSNSILLQGGRETGVKNLWAYIIGGIGLIGTILSIIFMLLRK